MTVRIPVRIVALTLYTFALLAAAFGISAAVSDWREDDAITKVTQMTTTTGISAVDARQIARDEAERGLNVTFCLLVDMQKWVLRREMPTQAELQALEEGCRDQAGW
jgi:hypothetical protein